jgi:hypothetical protein
VNPQSGQSTKWFLKRDDAQALSFRVLQSALQPTTALLESTLQQLKRRLESPSFGILNRKFAAQHGRYLKQTDVIKTGIKRMYPTAQVTEMQDMGAISVIEQAKWMSTKDVIITPHGGHLVNLVFADRCASILELFPEAYAVPNFYQPLACAVSHVQPLYLYDSKHGILKAQADTENSWNGRHFARAANIASSHEIIELLPILYRANRECIAACAFSGSSGRR